MNRNLKLLKCPIIPNESSYEIISEGPVSIWYYGKKQKKTDYYAFQIIREVIPMLFITFNHQTSIIAQSSIPIYIPFDTNIVVDGKEVQLYLGEGCQITHKEKRKKYTTILNGQFEIPKSHIIVLHCANVKQQFHDVIQVIITDGMIAYCGGKNHILLNTSDTKITVLQTATN
ncbi:hypothetical protein LOAG_03958 [Loa loa]|uniref:Uncharacterized protein n=2 Tax=Loa loa TaxID=7209 RepID=A0A1S0U3P7_LOALO|nr:hypothetical protein LOAG_03958 [Loa loa]EFO24528.1 hypothetical protein LOAG_03958 [Loa loa]